MRFRIGNGFDSHRFIKDKKFILGGVEIIYNKGLDAHSDGDALIHAIIDCLLGASNSADIGELFPPNDISLKNINSETLLSQVLDLINKKNYEIINIDCIIICEEPKLKEYKPLMIKNLSKILKIKEEQINIKTKTAEKMGALGRKEGLAVFTTCLLNNTDF